MLRKVKEIFIWLVSMSGSVVAFVSSGVMQRVTTATADGKKTKASPRKSLSIVTSPACDGIMQAPTPRTEKRGFLNHMHDLLSPKTFVRQSKITIDKIRPLFSPMKCVEDAFRSPHIRTSFGDTVSSAVKSPAIARRKNKSLGDSLPGVKPPAIILTKLQEEREMNLNEIKEVALRGLVETIVFDVVSSALNEDGYMHSDPLYDTEHMAVKNVASDFITGTIDSMKRTAFPQLATMMVREMSAPTTDSSSARYDFADLKDPDQPVASDSTIANRVRAHIFTAKILIRYIVMPLLVRGVAHTAPALAFHLAETELKIIEHGHHFF